MTSFFCANSCLGIYGWGKHYGTRARVAAGRKRCVEVKDHTMSKTTLVRCTPGNRSQQRRKPASDPTPGMQWMALAVAIVALFLMLNGARWLLHESPPAANELLVATCAIDSIASDETPLRVCTETPRHVH